MTPPSTRLVLVRHGEPSEEVRGRCYGRMEIGLSPRGRAQAAEASALLGDVPVAALYSSPQARARETAAAFAAPRGLPIVVDERLREIDFGELEGLTWDEARARHPEVYEAWMSRPTSVTFPGGESWTILRARSLAAQRDIVARHPGETVVVVAHGGVHRALVADALGLADEHVFKVDQSYGCVSVVDHHDGGQWVRLLNGGWRA